MTAWKVGNDKACAARQKAALLLLTGLFFLVVPGPALAGGHGLDCNKRIAVAAVKTAALGLGNVLKDVSAEKEQKAVIRAFIEKVRFYPDDSGYFYVYNYACVNVAHATQKDLVGKDLSHYQDPKGKFVIRELSAAAQAGGGFVRYYWVKPGVSGQHDKLGYVEPIPNTPYFIGTGVYLEEE